MTGIDENPWVKSMPESNNPFDEIFKRLTKEEFMADPTRILSLMMDFGFDPRQVKMLRTVMDKDMMEVEDYLTCHPGSESDIIRRIADYCCANERSLKDILRRSLHGCVETEIIEDEKYGRCRRSTDGVATYSLDMTKLYRVTDVDSFTISDLVKEIGSQAFEGCSSLEEVYIPNSVTKIGSYAFSRCRSLTDVIGNEQTRFSLR